MTKDLQSIGDAAGHDAGIHNRQPGRLKRFPGRSFVKEDRRQAQNAADGKLQQRHPHAVYHNGKALDGDDVQGEKAGADKNDHIAVIDAEIFVDADEVHAGSGDQNTEPLQPGNGFMEDEPEQGHDNDVEGGNEAGFTDRGIAYADLLQRTGDRQHDTTDDAAGDQVLTFGLVISAPNRKRLAGQSVKKGCAGNQKSGADQRTDSVEGESAYVVGTDALRYEGQAPDQGAEKQHQAAFKLMLLHL